MAIEQAEMNGLTRVMMSPASWLSSCERVASREGGREGGRGYCTRSPEGYIVQTLLSAITRAEKQGSLYGKEVPRLREYSRSDCFEVGLA